MIYNSLFMLNKGIWVTFIFGQNILRVLMSMTEDYIQNFLGQNDECQFCVLLSGARILASLVKISMVYVDVMYQ